jgi:hypothetical protein
MTEDDPLSMTFPPQYEASGMAFLVGRLRSRAGANYVPPEERMRQALTALDHIYVLANKPEIYAFYEIVVQQMAVERAIGTHQMIERLGMVGSPSAQRRLVTLASDSKWQLTERRAAALAFEEAVRRRGLALTQDEVLVQYDRYNASETQDRGTQRVLGAILDSIESIGEVASESR